MQNNTHTSSSDSPTVYQGNVASDEINLKEILVKLWRQRKFILIVTGIFFLLGIFIAFTSPVSYTASCTIVPQTTQRGGGNLGGLASMMGVNLGAPMSSETLSPNVYSHIIKSAPFCKEIMETNITVNKSSHNPITLYEYYTNNKYQSKSILQGVKKYTIGLPGTILSTIRSDNSSKDTSTTLYSDGISEKIITLSQEEKKVYEIINSNIHFERNPKDGYIKLGYTFAEPKATAIISQQLFNVLEKYVMNYKTQKQLDNLKFVENSYTEAQKEFLQKQANLAAFQDANRGLATATARTTERRLNSEYEVAFTVYNELAKQLEQSKFAVKESAPVLTVIDPIVVPREKSAPKRVMIIAIYLFLGLVIGVGWVFIKPFINDITNDVKNNK